MKKGLVVGIIILFVGVGVLSSVSSKDISVSDEEMFEYDIELEDNNEIEPLDEYTEIITDIWAFQDDYEDELDYKITGEGFFKHVEIWIKGDSSIAIKGIRHQFPWFFRGSTHHLIAPCCLVTNEGSGGYQIKWLGAIALGNIYY